MKAYEPNIKNEPEILVIGAEVSASANNKVALTHNS